MRQYFIKGFLSEAKVLNNYEFEWVFIFLNRLCCAIFLGCLILYLFGWFYAFLGVDFVDKRLEREEFGKLKETYPYKQVPILEIEG